MSRVSEYFPEIVRRVGERSEQMSLVSKEKLRGWPEKGIAVKRILNRRVDCAGANSATDVVAGGDFGAAGV